jgi:hypothetical protein
MTEGVQYFCGEDVVF